MQMSIDVNVDQLLFLIRNLPEEQLLIIQTEINKKFSEKAKENRADFLDMILQAPTMTSDEYRQFKENRKKFNQWRTL